MKTAAFGIWFFVLCVSGCGERSPAGDRSEQAYKFPPVNTENCTADSIAAMPEHARAEFSALCVRQSDVKQSPHREW